MAEKQKIILDCDVGHDDAFALMLAVAHLDVLGVTGMGGNVTLENVVTNIRKVLELVGRTDVPVFAGHSCPTVVPLVTAPEFHGPSGLDGPDLPLPKMQIQKQHAVDFIIDTVMAHDGVSLVATAPLTNIAAAINREPRIINRIKEISLMGGSATYGNHAPMAEFNIMVDPEAAYRVFNSGIHIKMSGLNLTRQCSIEENHVSHFREIGTRAANAAADMADFYLSRSKIAAKRKGAVMHDACAVAWLIDPSLITSVPMHVDVELHGTLTRGMTVCDSRHLNCTDPKIDYARTPQSDVFGKAPNAEVGMELDFDRFINLLYDTLAGFN